MSFEQCRTTVCDAGTNTDTTFGELACWALAQWLLGVISFYTYMRLRKPTQIIHELLFKSQRQTIHRQGGQSGVSADLTGTKK